MSKAPVPERTTKMGRRLLASGAANAASTANAIEPFARRGVGSLLSYLSGSWTSDLPLQALAGQAATAGHLVARGGLGTRAGKVGLALNVASWAGLVNLYRSAQADRDVLEEALLEGLGADYHERLGKVGPAADLPLTRRQIAVPHLGGRSYRSSRDVAYGDDPRHQLDIWHRSDLDPTAGAPVLLQIHGGAWVFGNKGSQGGPLMGYLAERGWVCVAINYSLSPRNVWPAHIVDVKRAIGWIRDNIAEHGGDKGFIAVTGGSAGGHLAALAALTGNDPAFQPGFEDVDTSIQAAVPFYGQYDFVNDDGFSRDDTIGHLERWVFKHTVADDRAPFAAASPLHRVHPGAPPFFVVHGTNDTILPAAQARHFAEVLKRMSTNPVAYAELPKAQHAFDLVTSVRTQHTVRAAERFLLWAHTADREGAVVA